jgi:homogentisate solanesyltransferase
VGAGLRAGEGAVGAFTAIYKFLRPHTIRGTILASVTGVARALVEVPSLAGTPWLALLPTAFLGMLALLLGNAFIVGINQIYDVDIDKVNKPFLPVAAGELSPGRAWALVLFAAAAGPAIVYKTFSPLIFKLYCFGTTVGCLYSVPPLRLKRFPLAAGVTIATVRGFLLNFGVYYAAREALGLSFAWNPAVSFLAGFMTVFAATIAVTKDLPDIEGDKLYGVETFATKLGVAKIANAATAVLLLNYAGAAATALLAPPGTYRAWFMAPAHLLAGGWLFKSWRKLDPSSTASVKKYYKRIWDLFYLEYIMYPFI